MSSNHFLALADVLDAVENAPDPSGAMTAMMVFFLSGSTRLNSVQAHDAVNEAFVIFNRDVIPKREEAARLVAESTTSVPALHLVR